MAMVWEPEVEELQRRRALAKQMGGTERILRQHASGKLTIRERIDRLADPGTFKEVGQIAGQGTYHDTELVDFMPDSFVGGIAELEGRPVVLGGADFTIRGGSATKPGKKGGLTQDLAFEYRMPYVNLLDAAGANIEAVAEHGHTYLPSDWNIFDRLVRHMGQAPVVAAVLGSVAGGPAGYAVLAHFNVMVKGTSCLFASGPPVVKRALGHTVTKEELGGSKIHTRESGCVDNEATDEEDAFRQIRRFLSFMPSNVWELPPSAPPREPPANANADLIDIVPRDRKRPYNMKKLISLLVDGGDSFEIQPAFGMSLITVFARIEGKVVGIVANNPLILGGAMDGDAADKQGKFMELCDLFNIPVIYLVDIPGFMIGTHAEKQGTLRRGMRTIWSWSQMTVPTFTVQVRKCYGMAGAATSNAARLSYRVAWPSGEFGSIPIEGGVDAAFRREIESANDPDARREELENELAKLRNVFRTAETMGVEEVIDPRETRAYLVDFVNNAYRVLPHHLGPKTRFAGRP
jgi:acetyl-CoA carboxylase carboxyltransferase component